MKHISILIPIGHSSLPNIDGSHQILSEVNGFLKRFGKEPAFNIQLVGLTQEVSQREGLYIIQPDCTIENVKKTDLIIIPAMHGDLEHGIKMNAAFIPWILQQRSNGAEIASLCIGAFFLAATGLLDGKKCATHWSMASQFRQFYPAVNLVDDKILTDDNGIYTSGGAYSFINLLVYLIEKYQGREIAILIAKVFMIDINKNSQSPFMMFNGQKDHEDIEVKNAQEYIEQHLEDKISVEQLADRFAVGRRSFERRFKKATSNTVGEYVQRVKVEAAKKQLEMARKNVSEIMYEVGYNDTKAFRNVFRKITGLSPIEYRNKYNRLAS